VFESHNLRCTSQRCAIYKALKECKTHPTAEELLGMVRSDVERVSLATIYNTLETLCEAGLVRKIPTAHGFFRWDADTTDHPHVKVTSTGEVIDVPMDLSMQLMSHVPAHVLREVEQRLGVRIDSINLHLVASRLGGSAGMQASKSAEVVGEN